MIFRFPIVDLDKSYMDIPKLLNQDFLINFFLPRVSRVGPEIHDYWIPHCLFVKDLLE